MHLVEFCQYVNEMLQSDWQSYSLEYRWLPVLHEMRCCYSFSEVLEGILDVNG